MTTVLDRDALLGAFGLIGAEASRQGVVLHIAVYGGSALILASNFRCSSEDVDIAELPDPKPAWLEALVGTIAARNGWPQDWLNDAVSVHLSGLASRAQDHVEFGSFPRGHATPGLVVYLPTADYMLALKAVRVLDPVKGEQESADIRNLMAVAGVGSGEAAAAALAKYFPRSAANPANSSPSQACGDSRRIGRCARIPSPKRLTASRTASRGKRPSPSSSTTSMAWPNGACGPRR